jgi:PAS domain S-box-containing protein
MTDPTLPFNLDNNTEITRLEAALDAAHVGTWEYNLVTEEFRLCKRFKTIFNHPFDHITTFENVLNRVHPAYRDFTTQELKKVLAREADHEFDIEFRTVDDDKGSHGWINCKGQAHFSENGEAFKISGIALEITKNIRSRRQLSINEERFRSLIEEAPIATCLFVGREMKIEVANDTMIGYWGKDKSVFGKPLLEALPEMHGQEFPDILDHVFMTGETYNATNFMAELEVNGVLSPYYFDFTYKALRNAAGEIYAVMDTAVDVTDKVLSQKALEASEAKLKSVIATAPAAIGLFVGRELIIEMPNQAFIDICGKGSGIVGKPLKEALPELENQPYLQIMDDIFTSGKMFQSFGSQVDIIRDGVMTHNFYNITYTPLLDSNGEVYAILDIAIDVTESVLADQLVKESQMELLTLFEQSPIAIAMLSKEDLKFTMANPYYGQMVGRSPEELIGKNMLEALPEREGQGFDKLIMDTVRTGEPYFSKEAPINVLRAHGSETIFVNLTYQPKLERNGEVSGILVIATDVTQQVLSRQKIQEAEMTLRGAVELANLGTWQIDFATGILDYSPRLREWFGIGANEIITVERAYAAISQSDHPRVLESLTHAITPETDGLYDVEYNVNTGSGDRERILHAQGKTYFDKKGTPVKISGTVQDVTEQRKVQLALEQLVQERTEELETTNEELAAINEEYAATNDELAKSNELLIRSNENLQQFAYIASHDLQEPLRKIQSFGDLLKKRYAPELGPGADFLERMQNAAMRMSTLIEDLLTFSRVSMQQDVSEQVSLNNIIKSVLTDLDFAIQETRAVITIGPLPVIEGDSLQLGQLYQNLISNALKFHRPDHPPHIEIHAEIVSPGDLPDNVKPGRLAQAYHRIDVKDNGIGFDVTYTNRIFQIFQRLHGKTEYAGTGIGLAICEKVANNHGGAITATSVPGHGSVFSVFFPV